MRRDWSAVNAELIEQLERSEAMYRPTNFWTPGVQKLLNDMDRFGLDQFKRWPSATSWFYPVYGHGITNAVAEKAYKVIAETRPNLKFEWVRSMLTGSYVAQREFDVSRLAWDNDRWPFDLESHGESPVGRQRQRVRLADRDDVRASRSYINYLQALAALSQHVERPPTRVLELGGGFGALGEILWARDPDVVYVDVDIPPLATVAAYYLDQVTGGVAGPTDLPEGKIEASGRMVLPTWRLPDLVGPFDVFVNTASFQEMEPHVVENYVGLVASVGVEWIVSRNSREGKRAAVAGREGGAINPVTSGLIVEMFADYGFRPVARWGRPLISSAGELVVMQAA